MKVMTAFKTKKFCPNQYSEIKDILFNNIRKYNNAMKERHDKKLSSRHNIQIGGKVLDSTRGMLKNGPGLLDPRSVGPFTVKNIFSNSVFVV
jgi:hypothetical protein